MKPKSNIVHLPVYQPGKPLEEVKKELGLSEVIKLASNENPFGCSEHAKQAILEDLDNLSIYPDGGSLDLTAAVAEFVKVEPNQIIFGCGSDEIILMIARAYLVPGDETVMAAPTFPQYKHNADIEGAKVIEVPLRDGTHDLPAMISKVTDKTKVIWICNPNNPSGTIVSHDELADFLGKVPKSALVVLDEAYYEYITDPTFPNSLQLLEEHENVVILRTFSKIYGLAALRIGYGIGRPEVVRAINQVREPFNTSRLAQKAALRSLEDQAFIASCRERNRLGIDFLTERFDQMGLTYFPAHGNFVMVDTGKPAAKVFEGLLRKGVIVRGGHALGFPTGIRVTVGSQTQNEKFVAALGEVLTELGEQQIHA